MTKKEIAQEFLKLVARGNARDAFSHFVDAHFKHHNAYFKGDSESIIKAMEEDARMNPDKIFEIHRVLGDGNMVAVHSFVKQSSSDPGAALVHIFRFNKFKIAEIWDVGQPIPEELVNENGMF